MSTTTPLNNAQNLNLYNNNMQSYRPEIPNNIFNSLSSTSMNHSMPVFSLSENKLMLDNLEKNKLGLDDLEDVEYHESSFFAASNTLENSDLLESEFEKDEQEVELAEQEFKLDEQKFELDDQESELDDQEFKNYNSKSLIFVIDHIELNCVESN
ncbi:17193_t:CDS:1 [Cetraspora pellucida]|uniref:17193_t:CDS:1 n=1 Tax=Cetraspora pellucida TaxID=1433469 RepID=A0ACA9L7Z4_9GLOM|nr:17193_t:CDS:1 [Cetraspora pellucida]